MLYSQLQKFSLKLQYVNLEDFDTSVIAVMNLKVGFSKEVLHSALLTSASLPDLTISFLTLSLRCDILS